MNGYLAACNHQFNQVALWDLTTGRPIGDHSDWDSRFIEYVGFSPDSKTVVTATQFGTLRTWDANTGRLVKELAHASRQLLSWGGPIIFSSDGGSLITAEGRREEAHPKYFGEVKVYNPSTGEIIRRFDVAPFVLKATLSPDEKLLATAEERVLEGGTTNSIIEIWDLSNGEKHQQLIGHKGQISAVGFLPDGKTVLSASADNTLRMWDVSSGEEMQKIGITGHLRGDRDGFQEQSDVEWTVFSKTLTAYTSAGKSDLILGWDLSSGKQISALRMADSQGGALALSPDGKILAATCRTESEIGHAIRLWLLDEGREIYRFDTREMPIRALAFSPNGAQLVSGMDDGTALLWDLTAPRIQETEKRPGF